MGTKHSMEFKQEAVRVALTSGLMRKQVAADFGVGFATLSRWIQQGRQSIEEPSIQSDLGAEVAALRKENRLLREGIARIGLGLSARVNVKTWFCWLIFESNTV